MLNVEEDNSFIAKEEFPDSKLCDRCTIGKMHYVDNDICWIQTEKHKDEDTQYICEPNEETDEGLDSINQIVQACLDGNIEHFNFHLEKEIGPRSHLLMRLDNDGWSVLHHAAKVCKLLSENLNICQKTNSKMTVLHIV